nr:putative ribonuclease H-like domain-containing protein [Tanacetum cinerariifolium]
IRRNACFVKNLEGVDLLKGDRSTNLYRINLHEMASASPICLMARASSTKSWLWHQRLSPLNFDTINDLARNDLVVGLSKFKYHKEHLCPSCEQGKSKRASHPPKPVLNTRQRLHLLHMDLCGPMRMASINGKRYILVIVDDYSRYTWVHFLRSKDEAPAVIITFLKRITVLLQSPVIIIRTDNGTEFKNQVLKVYFDSVGISHQMSSVRTPQQNGVVERRNRTLVEAARTMLIFSRAPLFLWAEAIATASMAFEQRSSKPGLQCMTSGQISSGLDLNYAPSTITKQQPTEGELDLLFEAICDNRTSFKNRVMNEFCKEKGIKREYNIARTPQQNKAKAIDTACYVHNRVLVVKPYFKTSYELFRGRTPALSFMRAFGCHVTILNTLDHLGKFDGKSDEGFFVGYSTNSKAFRVYNTRTRKVEENLHINFLENKPIIAGTNSNDFAGKGASFDADLNGDNKDNDGLCKESEIDNQERPNAENNTKDVNTAGPSINTPSSNINTASLIVNTVRQSDDFFGANNDMRSLDGLEVDIRNISTTYTIPTTPNTRIHKDHSLDNVIGNMQSGVQTRRMTITTNEQGFISAIYEEKTHEDLYNCLFICLLSQEEPKRITNALKDPA